MKIVILDSATLGEDIDLSPIYDIGEVTEYKTTSPSEVEERLISADTVMVNKIKLNESNLKNAAHLRLICVTATGYDNIDTEYCRSHGIALCNVPSYSTDSVAQITVAMALSLVCRLNDYTSFVSSGKYSETGLANRLIPVYHEMSSMTWGIVGGGAIGSRVAEIATALGCRVIICRQRKDERYENADIDTLCQTADIISLHIPLTENTAGMIDRERIKRMKKGAIVINVARGAVADEAALAEAIESGHLGGIGVDVYSKEPFDSSHPFSRISSLPNVLLTPHMAWGAAEARERCVETVSKNILGFIEQKNTNRIV